MNREDLAPAVLYRFGAHAEPFNHQTAFCGTVAVEDDGSSSFALRMVIGSARIAARSASSIPETVFRRFNSGARTCVLSNAALLGQLV